ncbi:hypothetical protein CONCODRAFT_6533 [Conidiobolus coronatus NRRL 28638]|uniref:Sequence orphan n=1 Tax=Conidiobolus coronatus (strain ATCC 28846 / CBS 209.66 / NRRL 28638) TaxID=796925 RepID=A0A137P791_CONC2|nr:hypothetical protein CONCODRAFT_6533 [Conidiobolus coronatus NRRL 28638]|eukprot:KXN70829.1 hypothetical protein CONCODRAFT_6533 [Conidiobolus coronatus NRRL 28638]
MILNNLIITSLILGFQGYKLPSDTLCAQSLSASNKPNNLMQSSCIEHVRLTKRGNKLSTNNKSLQEYFTTNPDKTDSKVVIRLDCNADKKVCGKVRDAFNKAKLILEDIIEFKEPIIIDAKFRSECEGRIECIEEEEREGLILGAATPGGFVSLVDKDGVNRLFPKALAKQLDLDGPLYLDSGDFDILAEFNSDADWWFDGDAKMTSSQYDFFSTIAHELIHGLGFASSLNTYLDSDPSIISPCMLEKFDSDGETIFLPFVLDRLIVTSKDKKSIESLFTDYTKLSIKNSNNNEGKVKQHLKKSVSSTIEKFSNLTTTPESLSLLLANGETLVLNTKDSPFMPGTSVSHVADSKYTGTIEYLMVSRFKGGDVFQLIDDNPDWDTYPYGPHLVEVLGEIGYTLKKGYSTKKFFSYL